MILFILSIIICMGLAGAFALVANKVLPHKGVLYRTFLATLLGVMLPNIPAILGVTKANVAIVEIAALTAGGIALMILGAFPVAYLVARRVSKNKPVDSSMFE